MNRLIYFLLTLVLWFLLTWSLDIQNVIAGIIIALICTIFIGHLFFEKSINMLNPRRIFWFLYYIPVFFLHMVKANIDVAYRVIHLNIPIKPGIVKVTTTLKTDLGKTFLANSITLTPGTLTIDIIGSDMYIHGINVQTEVPEQGTAIIVSRFENIIKKVFE